LRRDPDTPPGTSSMNSSPIIVMVTDDYVG